MEHQIKSKSLFWSLTSIALYNQLNHLSRTKKSKSEALSLNVSCIKPTELNKIFISANTVTLQTKITIIAVIPIRSLLML